MEVLNHRRFPEANGFFKREPRCKDKYSSHQSQLIFGAKTLINVDGEDWARDKWTGFAKKYQKWCEKIACFSSNIVIADAKGILERYEKLYRYESIFVPYGANIKYNESYWILDKWGLKKNEYVLYVGRFVPENAIDVLIKAYSKVLTEKKLVIVGDAPYSEDYKKQLFSLASTDKRIIFTGYAFAEDYEQLSSHAYIYVQPAGIDGTRPVSYTHLTLPTKRIV